MEKSEMMNQSDFERLSQLMADKGVRHEAFELLADLRMSERNFAEKAQAYDRLMSGGRKTLKEWANIFGMPVAVDKNLSGIVFDEIPELLRTVEAWRALHGYVGLIPSLLIAFSGAWQDSLTLPDGWEEKQC